PTEARISDNFYWLSSKPDVLDPARNADTFMPNKSFADFTALGKLPAADVRIDGTFPGAGKAQVTLTNLSDKIAFFIELQIDKDRWREPVLPVYWDDNYVSLLPHETKVVTARFSERDLEGQKPILSVNGWNLAPRR